MGAGWIAQGADTPAPASDVDPWKPTAPDSDSASALVRPHQDAQAHPLSTTRGLMTQTRDLLFGHEPEDAQDTDRVTTPGIVPSVWRDLTGGPASQPEPGSPAAMRRAGEIVQSGDKSAAAQQEVEALSRPAQEGPRVGTMATALGHLYAADVTGVRGEVAETVGAKQTFNAQQEMAALTVLPQAIATAPGDDVWAKTEAAIANPGVKEAARKLGISPADFVHNYSQVAQLPPDEQARRMEAAKQTLIAGRQHTVEGEAQRGTAAAERAAWQHPSDLTGTFDPSSAKGLAFNVLAGAPAMAAVTAATLGGAAVGGPAGAAVAGDVAMQSLFLPGQRAGLRDQLDQVVARKLEQADELDRNAPAGQQRALNPQASALRQQAADLAASADKIVGSASVLYAAGNALGNAPVASILSKSPQATTAIERAVGPALAKTFGVQTAQTMLASGVGGALQQAFQTAVDNGVTHRDTTLAQAAQEIGYSFLVSAAAAAPAAGAHYAMGAPERARQAAADQRAQEDEVLGRAQTASAAMGGAGPSAVSGEEYPGYKWNPDAPNPGAPGGKGKYESTSAQRGPAPPSRQLTGDAGAAAGETGPGAPGSGGTGGAAGKRQAYQGKVDALNTAAAAAEKRSDVTLEPEEEGWSVHVNGQPVATFDTVEAARQAMATARKAVGTKPAEAETETPAAETKPPAAGTPAPIGETEPRQAETALERTQPIQAERRSATELRQRVADMTPDQMKAALLTHELTGVPNRRAYEDAPKKAVQVSVDSDGLKAINDFGTHAAGDQALKAVAAAMHAEAPNDTYHLSGDEFMAQADHEDGAHDLMARVNKRLESAVVEVTMPDGKVFHLKGLGVSYGVGKDTGEAETNLAASKTQRQAEGLRAPRGELPAQATIRTPEEGRPRNGGPNAEVSPAAALAKTIAQGIGAGTGGTNAVNPHAKVLGKTVETPDVPTPAQAKAGNYFKPSVVWHGVPVKVENTKGQMRAFVDARTGKPGKRKMRADYGYVPGTRGADADGVDIMMGPHPDVPKAWVIDQLGGKGKAFDEHKIQVGVRNADEARVQYLAHYPRDWKGLGGITELSADQLKHWLAHGDLSKPIDPESVPQTPVKRGPAPDARHDSLLQYLARHPLGLNRQEALAQGVDAADMALAAAHVGIRRAFRSGGMSFDHAAEALAEAGYPVRDREGHATPNALLDRVAEELRGRKVLSHANETTLPAEPSTDWRQPLSDADLEAMSAAQVRTRIAALEAERDRVERELERAGMDDEAEAEDVDRIPFMKKPGVQQDLFGDKVGVANEIKRLEAALDKKRNSGQESVETGRADDLFSQARDQKPLLKRGVTPGKGMEVAAVRAVVQRILSGFGVRPEVTVVDTLHDLDDHPEVGHIVRDAGNAGAVAFVHPRTNKIYLIADQLHTPDDVATAVAHEYITHFGLRAALGDRRAPEYQAILDGVARAMPAELRVRGEQEFPQGFNALNRHHRNIAAEEVLAYYGQEYARGQSIPARVKRWVDKLMAMIRDWVRQALGLPKKFDELFVRRTLADLESFLRRSKSSRAGPSTEGEPAFAHPQDTFFSGLAKAVDAARRDKGTGAEWEATLKNMPGVKAEELQWTGLKDWLADRGRVSKAEVADYVAAHRIQLGEKLYGMGSADDEHMAEVQRWLEQHGDAMTEDDVGDLRRVLVDASHGDASAIGHLEAQGVPENLLAPFYAAKTGDVHGAPKFGTYVAPGGKNYRELLMTLTPGADQAKILEGRKAVFDKWAPRIAEVDRRMDNHLYGRGMEAGVPLEVMQRERDALTDQRDAEADKVGYADPADRLEAARGAQDRARTDITAANRDLIEAWRPTQLETSNIYHWLTEAADPVSELHAYARGKLEEMVAKNTGGTFPDGGRALMDAALGAAAAGNRAYKEFIAATKKPNAAIYKGPHWDERNVLAHVRFDDRVGPQGEHVLHMAELQSDWHQAGRKHGYRGGPDDAAQEAKLKALGDERTAARSAVIDTMVEHGSKEEDAVAMLHNDIDDPHWLRRRQHMPPAVVAAMVRYHDTNNGMFAAQQGMTRQVNRVPDAPFKTTWPELAAKRMLRYAAEHGYDALSWDTGETSAERYDLSHHIDSVTAVKRVLSDGDADYHVKVIGKDGGVLHNGSMGAAGLENYLGKELAEKIVNQPPGRPEIKYEGLDLKVGGAGMKAFYDKMLPATVGKLVKKWGGAVESSTVTGGEGGGKYRVEQSPRGDWVAHNPQDQHDFHAFPTEVEALRFARDHVGEEAIPAHMVRITPAMRDSVMAGQPMFLKRRKGSSGAEPPKPTDERGGAYERVRRLVEAIPASELNLSFRRIVDPVGVSESSRATAVVTREALGELAQASEAALQDLERFSKIFDLLPTDDRYAFIHSMETGEPQANKGLQPAADAIRKLLDDWRENIRGLGVGALDNFIENYFPHIWQRDDRAKKIFGQIFGRRPLKGPASFLKERTIPTTKEGLDAGLTPISTNPLILAFAKLREMMRFYTGVKLMQRFKDEGLAKFLPSGKLMPDGWAEINDAVGRVRQWSEAEQGFVERGKYIMPTDGARVINNHLSASALRNFLPALLFRSVSNMANALQLGFSAFHLGFTTLDAVVSKNALAVERLLHGEPLQAAKAFAEGMLFGAPANLMRGRALMKAYVDPKTASPELRRIVDGLVAAGGRVKMDNYFQASQGLSPFKGVGVATLAHDIRMALTQPHNRVADATKLLTSFPQQYATRLWRDLVDMAHTLNWPWLAVPLEIVGRTTRASTSWIMEHIVPLQKLGVFSDLAADHIRRNPFEDPVAFAAAMQSIWNSVDNRLGEMVYDNVFWNRTFKDVNHMMVRAVGWNLGTIRELGGAPVDAVKLLDYLARGAPAEGGQSPLGKGAQARQGYEEAKSTIQRIAEKTGHKIPYTLALIGTTMILGAILTRLLTGKGPEDIKDYFFPSTGRMTKYGTPERISMPSYTKDLYEYGTQPVNTLINKANPIFGIIHAIYANEDFYGDPVRNADEGPWTQMWEGAKYSAKEIAPFSIQGARQFAGAGDMNFKGTSLTIAPYVGFGPAPARVTSPEQMDRYQLRETEKGWIRGLQRQLRAAQAKGDAGEVERLRNELRESKMKEKMTERDIRTDKTKARAAQSPGLDTSAYALPAGDPAANPANWGRRADGSAKGQGFLGLLKRPDGRVSSEISIGVEIDGQEREIPTMVPTLSQDELDYLMTHDVAGGAAIPHPIIQKAVDFARARIAAGKSPFAGAADHAAATADKVSALVDGKSRRDQVAALRDAGMPALAQLWDSMPARARPRVAASLEGFT